MKTTKYTFFTFLFFLLSLVFTNTFAQVTFKNGTDKVLLQVNDYGSTGTVSLPPFEIFPTLPINSNMLLNFDGTLFWNGSALGTSNNAAGWTHSGTNIYNTVLTDNVGIGTNNPQSKLSVGGDGGVLYSIFSANSVTNGVGIYSSGSGSGGTGVFGYSSANDGRGIVGQATGYRGRGVYGSASSTSQFDPNYGGYFESSALLGYGVKGIATATGNIENYGGYFKADGDQGKGVHGVAHGANGRGVLGFADGSDGRAIAGYANGTNGRGVYGYAPATGSAGYFDGNVQINGTTKIGSSGTPFLEILEVTGTTGASGDQTSIANAFPEGWTMENTRVLSLEISYGGGGGSYAGLGYTHPTLGGRSSSYILYADRNIRISYPDLSGFHNTTWRAIVMKMP